MLTDYFEAAMNKAVYEILPDDRSYYGSIPGFQGVWANARTLEDCRRELRETLEDWVMISIARHLPLPVVDNLELKIPAEI